MSANHQTYRELFQCLDEPLNSVLLRRFFLMLFRAHWADTDNHGSLTKHFNCLKYDEVDKERTLDVELSHAYDPDSGTDKPAIYVGFTGFTLKTEGLSDSIGRTDDNSARQEGKRADTVLRVGHIHKSSDIALLMAESNATLMQGIHKDLMANLELLKLDVLGWSDARPLEKAPTRLFQVDLQCAISYNFTVEIDFESHRIKKFSTEIQPQNC